MGGVLKEGLLPLRLLSISRPKRKPSRHMTEEIASSTAKNAQFSVTI